MGFTVTEPQHTLSTLLASDSAVYFWKGRVALYALLKAMGIGKGDEVIVPAFTCVVVPEAVLFAGAKPVYVDIERETLNLDPRQVENAITKRTRAVIVQHTFGLVADLDGIKHAIAGRDIRIIEDCAHTMSSLYCGKPVGTLGDGAFFSSQWTKPVTTGLGGIALTADPEFRARLKQFANSFGAPSGRDVATLALQLAVHGALFRPSLYWFSRDVLHMLTRAGLFLGSSTEEELSGQKPSDYERSMSGFQLRRLKRLLAGLDEYAEHRVTVQKRYASVLPRYGFRQFQSATNSTPVMLRYPVAVANKSALLKEARRRHVELGEWFLSPVHPVTASHAMQQLGYKLGSCPNGEWACNCIVNLPTHSRVTSSTIEKTCTFMATTAEPEWHSDSAGTLRPALTDVA